MPVWHRRANMRGHRGVGMLVTGDDSATLFDRNWNKLADLPVEPEHYVMPTGYHKVAVPGEEGGQSPWMFVRFVTEDDDPIVIAVTNKLH